MYVAGDLGFSSLLLLCLLFPVIGLVFRRKWHIFAAREQEIQRLLVLASEEAARAELEATFSYTPLSVPPNIYHCAVCYSPTTTRCARCKVVRYCSGKCQIMHWRQGHKEKCHPPSTLYHIKDDGSNSAKVAKQEQHNLYDGRYKNASIETSSLDAELSYSSRSFEVPCVEDDDLEVDSVVNRRCSISKSSTISFSGFSTPMLNRESYDGASVSSSFSSEPEVSDGQMSSDITSDMLEPSFNKVDHPSSPKFARLVGSVDLFNKLDQSKLHGNNGESQHEFTSYSGQSISAMCKGSNTKPIKVAYGFGGRTIDSVESSSDAQDDSADQSSGSGNSKPSNSESFSHVKFNLSQNVPSLHEQSSVVKGTMPDDALSATLGTSPVGKASASMSKSNGIDSLKNMSSPLENCDMPAYLDNNFSGNSNSLKSSKCKPVSLSSSHTCLTSSNGGNLFNKDSSKTYRPPPSNSKSVEFGKPHGSEDSSANSSQMGSIAPSSIGGLKSSMWKVVDQFRGLKHGRYGDKGLFPYDLFVKLYTSNKVDLRPCGLINCGNSCYANAVLQCLAFTPPLSAYFVQGLHSTTCAKKAWCFTCEFESIILKFKDGKSPLSPVGVLSQLQNIGSQLGKGREEDAHEFLRYAIDTMQSTCFKEAGVKALGSFEEETSLIGLTFGGYLHSKIKCMKCQYKSERLERMMDLTVEIEGDIGKLEDALKQFTGTEILDGDNKYQCTRCKSYEKAKKKLTILEAPNVLTIALKRFQSGKFGKINKSIRFPEILDLAPYMSGKSDKSPIYRLYGVVVHLDVMNASFSGHYVCYIKNIQNKWFKIDDSTVTAVELERVLTKGAYMLLYARCSPRAPKLIRNIKLDAKTKGSPSRSNIKDITLNIRSSPICSSSVQFHANSGPPVILATVESFYLKAQRLQKVSEDDSSSDSYSFTSNNSDEGSCSSDSTRDSTSTDDLSDYIFGCWNSPWRNPSDSDTSSSSSSSPLYSKDSPFTDMGHYSGLPSQTYQADATIENGHNWGRAPSDGSRLVDSECKGSERLLRSDQVKQCRKLGGGSGSRETDPVKLRWVNAYSDVKSVASFRRSLRERTG